MMPTLYDEIDHVIDRLNVLDKGDAITDAKFNEILDDLRSIRDRLP
jgi:hypothetical protein